MRPAVVCALAASALAVAAAGCSDSEQKAKNVAVTLSVTGAIVPASLTIAAGDSVTWTNQDTLPHGLASDDFVTFGTAHEIAKAGGTYGFRFTLPGTYGYAWSTLTKPSYPVARATVIVTQPQGVISPVTAP